MRPSETDRAILQRARELLTHAAQAGDTWRGLAHLAWPQDPEHAYWILYDSGVFEELNRLIEAREDAAAALAATPPESSPPIAPDEFMAQFEPTPPRNDAVPAA